MLSPTFVVAEPIERCFELFRMQNSQHYPRLHHWTTLGRTYSAPPDSPATQPFFSLKNYWIRHEKPWNSSVMLCLTNLELPFSKISTTSILGNNLFRCPCALSPLNKLTLPCLVLNDSEFKLHLQMPNHSHLSHSASLRSQSKSG